MDVTIEVCSREEAGAILSSPAQCADICFLVSIGDPEDHPPAGYRNVANKLRLLFADSGDHTGPGEADVKRIIAATRSLKGRSGRVLIHCAAGISRSTAAAIIIHTVLLGAGSEEESVRRVFEQRPVARPNRLMIDLADRLLERGGKLREAVDAAQNLLPSPRGEGAERG